MSKRAGTIRLGADAKEGGDALLRGPFVDDLVSLIDSTSAPSVIAVSAPYGAGKTVVMRMVEERLGKAMPPSKGGVVAEVKTPPGRALYINAWRNDHADDPLPMLVSAISALHPSNQKLLEATLSLSKKAIPIAFGAVLQHFLGIDSDDLKKGVADLSSLAAKELLSHHQDDVSAMDAFSDALLETVDPRSECPSLVVLIDDLDRCRPRFAIQLLERIKHVFDIDGVCFVLAVDETYLSNAIKHEYGDLDDKEGYLLRLVDHHLRLPPPTFAQYSALGDSLVARCSSVSSPGHQFTREIARVAAIQALRSRQMESLIRIALDAKDHALMKDCHPLLFAWLASFLLNRPEGIVECVQTGTVTPFDRYIREETRKPTCFDLDSRALAIVCCATYDEIESDLAGRLGNSLAAKREDLESPDFGLKQREYLLTYQDPGHLNGASVVASIIRWLAWRGC